MQSSEDIWVKVDADRHSVRIEYVGDRSLLPKVLADLPQIQSGIHESDEVQINRDRGISSGQMHRQDAAKDVAVSQHRLLTWCAIGSVVLMICFLFVRCGGNKNDQGSVRNGDRTIASITGCDRWLDGTGAG